MGTQGKLLPKQSALAAFALLLTAALFGPAQSARAECARNIDTARPFDGIGELGMDGEIVAAQDHPCLAVNLSMLNQLDLSSSSSLTRSGVEVHNLAGVKPVALGPFTWRAQANHEWRQDANPDTGETLNWHQVAIDQSVQMERLTLNSQWQWHLSDPSLNQSSAFGGSYTLLDTDLFRLELTENYQLSDGVDTDTTEHLGMARLNFDALSIGMGRYSRDDGLEEPLSGFIADAAFQLPDYEFMPQTLRLKHSQLANRSGHRRALAELAASWQLPTALIAVSSGLVRDTVDGNGWRLSGTVSQLASEIGEFGMEMSAETANSAAVAAVSVYGRLSF
jgi:hypothetical protein